jgi:hypothetical protein
MSKTMMSMLSTFPLTCLAFLGLYKVGLSVYGSCFLPRTLVQSLPGPTSHFYEICTKFDAVPLSGPSLSHFRPDTLLQIEERKKSAHPPICVELCILTPNMVESSIVTITTVQTAQPVPKIMDTSYFRCS